MHDRIKELKEQAMEWVPNKVDPDTKIRLLNAEKFAELIVRECTGLLFDESERLYGYSTECDNMRESDEAELVAEKCVDLITMIEEHFGVEEWTNLKITIGVGIVIGIPSRMGIHRSVQQQELKND